MYKELNVSDLNTDELAKLYKKLNKGLQRVPDGCWEWAANKKVTSGSLRIPLKSERTENGVNIEAVKAIDIIRKREGYTVEPNRGYVTSCMNNRCLNPAHQIKPKDVAVTSTTENYEMCVMLRENGWSTHYQITESSPSTYNKASKDEEVIPTAPMYLLKSIDYNVLLVIAKAMKFGKPTISELLNVTGLTLEKLLPYGYAVSTIESRIGTPEKADRIIKIIEMFIQGIPSSDIARELDVQITQITSFRGGLYG